MQDRMAFQGEYFVDRYGEKLAERTPPIRRMLELGVPVGAGTDATRVSSYNPFIALYWLITGKTIGGAALYPENNRLDRMEALRLYTVGSSWFSSEEGKKGSIALGQLADLCVLLRLLFDTGRADQGPRIGTDHRRRPCCLRDRGEFERLGPRPLPVSPDWSPVKAYGGTPATATQAKSVAHTCDHSHAVGANTHRLVGESGLWSLGCDCFAF